MKKIIGLLTVIIFSALTTSITHAGFKGLTIHSRANCMSINENIAWDFTQQWTLWTKSRHTRMNNVHDWHENSTGWETTRRNAIVHWTEAPPGVEWQVYGEHWMLVNNRVVVLGSELVTTCTLYNGWWDVNI